MAVHPLRPDQLYRTDSPVDLDFETTAELEGLKGFIGQTRAEEAIIFSMGVHCKGYNLFALGPTGTGKYSLVRQGIEERAATEDVPADWCYVFNFHDAHRPQAIRMPPGAGDELSADMNRLLEDVFRSLAAAFESDEYLTRSQAVEEALQERQEQALSEVHEKAKEKKIALLRTPSGFTLAPVRKGHPIGLKDFQQLPETERKKIEEDIETLQGELRETLHKIPGWQKETHNAVETLNREMAESAVQSLLQQLLDKYRALPQVTEYLRQVEQDIIANFREFLPQEQKLPAVLGINLRQKDQGLPWHNRYRVNVLLAHDKEGGAPVVYEDLPSYNNLIGRIEHRAQLGALETDFTMIRSGALHRANGGYLILDARKILTQPFAWEALKRVLQSGEIKIESLAQLTSLISTVSLEPQPIPLQLKVVLLGERQIYYLLARYDPEFNELFKVSADFDDRMNRDAESCRLYAQMIATQVRADGLRHFERAAVVRIIDQSARLADDQERLSAHMRSITDLIRESDYWAGQNAKDVVSAEDVQQAIDAQIGRGGRIRDRLQEEIARGGILIDTAGAKVGQVNGLAVISLGSFTFGRPSRITARARLGKGQVVDIEREVELGGPIHSKGVLILSGYLAGRFALDHPLSLSASLVFEQSYGAVDGDSASSAELYALLSALADIPLRQSLAVTGSVNQLGEIQAIGGVNEKIEGFFDTCSITGLTGDQGVLIPASNTKHLMLRKDVVQAVSQGRFAIYPVASIDQGMELLTGLSAGQRDAAGEFPEGTVNQRIEARLVGFSERLRDLGSSPTKPEHNSGGEQS